MTFSTTEQDFILEWAGRWCGLMELIFDYLRTDDISRSPISPPELDQINYQNLRSWFLDNEIIFLPLWKDFCTSRDWALDTSNDLIAEIRDAQQALENPFFCWYGPEDLEVFFRAYVIDPESRQVNEKKAWTTAMDLLRFDSLASEFACRVRDDILG